MVFHWSLSDSKFPQISRTLLSILANLNAVVWMVCTHPLTSKSSSPFINPLVTLLRALITIGINVTLVSNSFFNSLAKSRCFSSFSLLSILLCAQLGQPCTQLCKFSYFFIFVVDYYKVVWLRLSNPFLFKNPIGFCLILQYRCWFVHIIKFKFLAQFLVGHFAHPVVSSLILFLC